MSDFELRCLTLVQSSSSFFFTLLLIRFGDWFRLRIFLRFVSQILLWWFDTYATRDSVCVLETGCDAEKMGKDFAEKWGEYFFSREKVLKFCRTKAYIALLCIEFDMEIDFTCALLLLVVDFLSFLLFIWLDFTSFCSRYAGFWVLLCCVWVV